MKGYFGIGVERINKPQNLGNLLRTAHAFNASFFFTIDACMSLTEIHHSDTSKAYQSVPFHEYASVDDFRLPKGCQLVGVELVDEAIELPSFNHPRSAAYILGPEKDSLSEAVLSRCHHVIKIPTKFCVNVGVAGALVMYDRVRSQGRHLERPVKVGAPTEKPKIHKHGGIFSRR